MNNNRIAIKKSRSKYKVIQRRALLMAEVHKLLSRGSNYEVMENGRIFIKSLKKYKSSNTKIRLILKDEKGNGS